MAYSYSYFKEDIVNYLKERFNADATILDVGAGSGTYYNYLHEYFKNIDAVEIFKQNIDNFKLTEKYNKVYNENITNLKYHKYDIVIFGDIIEHLNVEDAKQVLEYAYNNCKEMIVAVPYELEQDEVDGNIYEKHLQADLTKNIMKERYSMLKEFISNEEYGYYIKNDIYSKT